MLTFAKSFPPSDLLPNHPLPKHVTYMVMINTDIHTVSGSTSVAVRLDTRSSNCCYFDSY